MHQRRLQLRIWNDFVEKIFTFFRRKFAFMGRICSLLLLWIYVHLSFTSIRCTCINFNSTLGWWILLDFLLFGWFFLFWLSIFWRLFFLSLCCFLIGLGICLPLLPFHFTALLSTSFTCVGIREVEVAVELIPARAARLIVLLVLLILGLV
jgi:hypothetical protein